MAFHCRALAVAVFLVFLSCVHPLVPQKVQKSIPVPPNLQYFDYQKDAIRALVGRRNMLLCDEMGLGKTPTTIGGLNSLGGWNKVLIVAPKSLLTTWEAELERWLVDHNTKKNVAVATARSGIPQDCNVLLINYDIVNKFREEIDAMGVWDVLVCDEAHYLKNGEALRTTAILGDTSTPTNEGAIQAKYKWFLTGSPVLNNPKELYPLLRALDPRGKVIPELREEQAFLDRYCGRRDTPWGVIYKGGKNLSELRERLRSGDVPLMLRRTKNEVLKDLPEKRHQLIPIEDEVVVGQEESALREALKMAGVTKTKSSDDTCDLSSLKVSEIKTRLQARGLPTSGRKAELVDRLRQYSIAESRARMMEGGDKDTAEVFDSIGLALRSETRGRWEGLQSILKGIGFDKDDNSKIFGALAQARHATALEKVPYAIELIENAIVTQKVVVFAHHRDVQDALMEAFAGQAVVLNGGSTQDERADVVKQFQEDESIRVFIGSIRAAGVGITLTAASHVIFVEFDWSPMIVQQGEDRCHRVGQRSSVLVKYLFFRGTIDEHLASLLSSKQSTVSVAVDAPTGAVTWVFDFGKHRGETVADVAASSAGYLRWVVDERAYIGRPDLAKALHELGYISDEAARTVNEETAERPLANKKPRTNQVMREARSPQQASNHEDFVISFGKHKGKSLSDIPKSYLGWLVSSGATRNQSGLKRALSGMVNDDTTFE